MDDKIDMMMLKDIHGNHLNNVTLQQIKDAYLELFRLKGYGNVYISIMHAGREMELLIYQQSIVLNDYMKYYDGPGGPGELLSTRYKEGTMLPFLEKIAPLLVGGADEELIKILKSLPKP